MKKFQKILLFLVLAVFLWAGSAFALSISVYDTAPANPVMVEDFEDFTFEEDGQWFKNLTTDVGTFDAAGLKGEGETSYNANIEPDSNDPYFSIRSKSWFGRGNQTTEGSYWLDSGDITQLDLTVNTANIPYRSLFFTLQDPSDVGATTEVEGGTAGEIASYTFENLEPNNAVFLVGILWDADETLSSISWKVSTQNDGYGLDNFQSAPVPEPATMLLLGSGLIGLAGIGRRKFFGRPC
jgi:hypothetical protein